jgi:hypothetical protein
MFTRDEKRRATGSFDWSFANLGTELTQASAKMFVKFTNNLSHSGEFCVEPVRTRGVSTLEYENNRRDLTGIPLDFSVLFKSHLEVLISSAS